MGWNRIEQAIEATPRTEALGRLQRMVGLVAESQWPAAKVGDLCLVDSSEGQIPCEAVGFRDRSLLLMPLGEAEGLQSGGLVRTTGTSPLVPVGSECWAACSTRSANRWTGFPLWRVAPAGGSRLCRPTLCSAR